MKRCAKCSYSARTLRRLYNPEPDTYLCRPQFDQKCVEKQRRRAVFLRAKKELS